MHKCGLNNLITNRPGPNGTLNENFGSPPPPPPKCLQSWRSSEARVQGGRRSEADLQGLMAFLASRVADIQMALAYRLDAISQGPKNSKIPTPSHFP
jgi:hypothetical protein